jgi:hypothetical protein
VIGELMRMKIGDQLTKISFRHHSNLGVYMILMSDIPELYEIESKERDQNMDDKI